MNEQRVKKLESLILEQASTILVEELKEIESDFWLINITWAKLSNDLSYLDIFVNSFKNKEILTKTIAPYAPNVQRKIYKKIAIRKLPKLRFRYDESWEISQDIIKTINNL